MLGEGNTLLSLFSAAQSDPQILVLPFSALAQSCKTWEEYELRLAGAGSAEIELAALGLVGPKKDCPADGQPAALPLSKLAWN